MSMKGVVYRQKVEINTVGELVEIMKQARQLGSCVRVCVCVCVRVCLHVCVSVSMASVDLLCVWLHRSISIYIDICRSVSVHGPRWRPCCDTGSSSTSRVPRPRRFSYPGSKTWTKQKDKSAGALFIKCMVGWWDFYVPTDRCLGLKASALILNLYLCQDLCSICCP